MIGNTFRDRHGAVALLLVLAVLTIGCGTSATGDSGAPRVLTSLKAKGLLLQLPYHYQWRQVTPPQGASGAVAGKVVGKHRTFVYFGISLGTEAGAVPVPHAGTDDPYDYSEGGGFVFNDDLEVPGKHESVHRDKQFHTAAQWNEATTMVVEMQEKLCKASTGRPCPP